MKQAIPWLTSIITLYAMYVIGEKKWWGWLVGLGNQVLWVALDMTFGTWGLLPLTAALIVLYTRNLIRWRRGSRCQCCRTADVSVGFLMPDDPAIEGLAKGLTAGHRLIVNQDKADDWPWIQVECDWGDDPDRPCRQIDCPACLEYASGDCLTNIDGSHDGFTVRTLPGCGIAEWLDCTGSEGIVVVGLKVSVPVDAKWDGDGWTLTTQPVAADDRLRVALAALERERPVIKAAKERRDLFAAMPDDARSPEFADWVHSYSAACASFDAALSDIGEA